MPMPSQTSRPRSAAATSDHRSRNAERKRVQMRARILMATLQVHADRPLGQPVIDHVIQEAGVSRGTFYKYFDSLDQALLAVGRELSEQFVLDLLPVHDALTLPWQRFAVGFRLFLMRAAQDPLWAAFVSRVEVWPRDSLVGRKMVEDVRNGHAQGFFTVADADAAAEFLKGASLGCIQALRQGVAEPQTYIDGAVRMGLSALGCEPALTERGVAYAARYLDGWTPRRVGVAAVAAG